MKALFTKTRFSKALAGLALAVAPLAAFALDHSHAAWSALLKKHVVVAADGKSSTVRYGEFAKDRAAVKKYIGELEAVTKAEYEGWNKNQRFSFLANLYNAVTIDLMIEHYGKIKSIRELGYRPWDSVWKKKLFKLFGNEYYLDGVEHEVLRGKGNFDDPRVHYAVNCASTGCPMLGTEALQADKLDAQLNDLEKRFVSDRTRNRYNEATKQLEVSKIYDWFKVDFNSGFKGINSTNDYFAKFAKELSDKPEIQQLIAQGKADIKYLDYDWSLNDAKK